MIIPPVDQVAAYTAAFIGLCGAVFERLRNKKKEDKTEAEKNLLSDARMFQERGEILKTLADDNLSLYKAEHEDHKKTRDYWHEKASEFQTTLAKCQVQIEEFKSRPDLTQVVKYIEAQSATSVAILGGIRDILEQIKRLYPATTGNTP